VLVILYAVADDFKEDGQLRESGLDLPNRQQLPQSNALDVVGRLSDTVSDHPEGGVSGDEYDIDEDEDDDNPHYRCSLNCDVCSSGGSCYDNETVVSHERGSSNSSRLAEGGSASMSTLTMIILSYNNNDPKLAMDNVKQGTNLPELHSAATTAAVAAAALFSHIIC
jgi:hypothetical protein